MLGRITPGRLPTTQANIDLIGRRIQFANGQLIDLTRKLEAGIIDRGFYHRARHQLVGEISELNKTLSNSRLSTPSYEWRSQDLRDYQDTNPEPRDILVNQRASGMLAGVVPVRLPTTQANIDLVKNRIKQVQYNMTALDQKVKAGTIDSQQAGYLRRQLIGEVDELRRVIANSRLSTPSYKVPRDLQVYRGSKPANKYVSYADSRAFISDYDGVAPVNKMPSDWQATELSELDVPDVPAQTGQTASWPSHWPGQHSPLIMQTVMQAGEINGKQIIDPRTQLMKLNLNMVQSKADMDTALVLKSRYTLLYQQATDDIRFTFTDRTLINIIMGKINLQVSVAEAAVEQNRLAYNKAKELAEAAKGQEEAPYSGQDDTNSGDKSVDLIPGTGNGDEAKVGTGKETVLADELVMPAGKIGYDNGWTYYQVDIVNSSTKRTIRSKYYAAHPAKYGFAPSTPEGGQLYVDNINKLDAAIKKKVADYDADKFNTGKYIYYEELKHGNKVVFSVPSGYKAVDVYEKQWPRDKNKYNYNYFYDGKLFLTANGQSRLNPSKIKSIIQNQFSQVMFNGQTNQYAENGHPLVFYASGGKGGFESLGGYHKTARMARRNGSLMGFGAMQSHDRYRNISPAQRVQSRTQRQSYLTTERELTMAKARAGAKVDITQELKKAPVTRPWSMQVSLPSQMIEEIHITLDSSLTQIGLTQGMFTQQAHNYIASIVNSLDSSMNPSERTEFVVETIMSEMVNRSALLKDNVRVDVRQNGWPPINIAPAETTSVDGLGSAFLKTKAAMGRLLG
jgi:hypothetical protein